uniref:Uncharacterized protein n=1 Tax=Chelonoidis abingdonii TaxID=106734 RepID=A0A8C0JDU7_CHEAB
LVCLLCFDSEFKLACLVPYGTNSAMQLVVWVWWCAAVIPATWKAETGRSLEPRGSGLWCAMPIRCPVPLTV